MTARFDSTFSFFLFLRRFANRSGAAFLLGGFAVLLLRAGRLQWRQHIPTTELHGDRRPLGGHNFRRPLASQ